MYDIVSDAQMNIFDKLQNFTKNYGLMCDVDFDA